MPTHHILSDMRGGNPILRRRILVEFMGKDDWISVKELSERLGMAYRHLDRDYLQRLEKSGILEVDYVAPKKGVKPLKSYRIRSGIEVFMRLEEESMFTQIHGETINPRDTPYFKRMVKEVWSQFKEKYGFEKALAYLATSPDVVKEKTVTGKRYTELNPSSPIGFLIARAQPPDKKEPPSIPSERLTFLLSASPSAKRFVLEGLTGFKGMDIQSLSHLSKGGRRILGWGEYEIDLKQIFDNPTTGGQSFMNLFILLPCVIMMAYSDIKDPTLYHILADTEEEIENGFKAERGLLDRLPDEYVAHFEYSIDWNLVLPKRNKIY